MIISWICREGVVNAFLSVELYVILSYLFFKWRNTMLTSLSLYFCLETFWEFILEFANCQ